MLYFVLVFSCSFVRSFSVFCCLVPSFCLSFFICITTPKLTLSTIRSALSSHHIHRLGTSRNKTLTYNNYLLALKQLNNGVDWVKGYEWEGEMPFHSLHTQFPTPTPFFFPLAVPSFPFSLAAAVSM
ncbi:hypothetical protein J3R30DRAFT_3499524 [Lentinula aciculospora]|uniref:Uncharacterized protein n=1 Tax=Lentinula aciculospora TaxID=153920 RepID=A0A9W9A7M0_9AGAR|nr:hypothetical protein J3R30DRAFT_3499524 [Lentinula aciculospora]